MTHITEQLPENFHKEQHKQERDSLQESYNLFVFYKKIMFPIQVHYIGKLLNVIGQKKIYKHTLHFYTHIHILF